MKGRLHFGPGTSAKPWKTAAVSTSHTATTHDTEADWLVVYGPELRSVHSEDFGDYVGTRGRQHENFLRGQGLRRADQQGLRYHPRVYGKHVEPSRDVSTIVSIDSDIIDIFLEAAKVPRYDSPSRRAAVETEFTPRT